MCFGYCTLGRLKPIIIQLSFISTYRDVVRTIQILVLLFTILSRWNSFWKCQDNYGLNDSKSVSGFYSLKIFEKKCQLSKSEISFCYYWSQIAAAFILQSSIFDFPKWFVVKFCSRVTEKVYKKYDFYKKKNNKKEISNFTKWKTNLINSFFSILIPGGHSGLYARNGRRFRKAISASFTRLLLYQYYSTKY